MLVISEVLEVPGGISCQVPPFLWHTGSVWKVVCSSGLQPLLSPRELSSLCPTITDSGCLGLHAWTFGKPGLCSPPIVDISCWQGCITMPADGEWRKHSHRKYHSNLCVGVQNCFRDCPVKLSFLIGFILLCKFHLTCLTLSSGSRFVLIKCCQGNNACGCLRYFRSA